MQTKLFVLVRSIWVFFYSEPCFFYNIVIIIFEQQIKTGPTGEMRTGCEQKFRLCLLEGTQGALSASWESTRTQ
jgi:hypothetical protein